MLKFVTRTIFLPLNNFLPSQWTSFCCIATSIILFPRKTIEKRNLLSAQIFEWHICLLTLLGKKGCQKYGCNLED